MSEHQSGVPNVRNEIAIVAGPKNWGDTRESWLAKVPRAVKKLLETEDETITFRTVKALWYGEINDPQHWAARDIRRAAEAMQARKELADARRTTRSLADQYETIAGGMLATDPDFHGEDISALIHAARILRGLDRPRDNGEGS